MRALTIYEPYAGLIAGGIKTIEVRRQPLNYRGPLLIHAAKGDRPAAVIGTAQMVDCRPLTNADLPAAVLDELPAHQVYGLVLEAARRLPGRVEWRGRQGLWIPESELREHVADVLSPWGREVAEAAHRAGLRLSRHKHTWRVHPPGQSDAKLRYGTSAAWWLGGQTRTVEVCGSTEDGERMHREFMVQEDKHAQETRGATTAERARAEAAAAGLELKRTAPNGWMLWDEKGNHVATEANLGDVAERIQEIKKRRKTRMARVTKKEVTEAAQAAGLRLLSTRAPHNGSGRRKPNEWALVDERGNTIFADSSMASLLQRCRDHQAAQAAPESMPAAPAVVDAPLVVDAPPDAAPVPHLGAVEATAGAAEADRLYGGNEPYDLDRSVARARARLNDAILPMLEAGAELIRIKEHEPHGTWATVLEERIGISQFVAKSMMRAARKFLDSPNRRLVADLKSVTKVYELALMDDDDLAELREGGTIAGATLDDIQRMSPSELRAVLRATRKEANEREDAQRERIKKKDAQIEQLEGDVDGLRRTLEAARNPGRKEWTDTERGLLLESARADMDLRRAVENFEAVIERLHEHAGKEDARAQSRLGGLHNVPAAKALLDVRGRLDATSSYLHGKLGYIDERLSEHLATERPAPDDVMPWEVPTPPGDPAASSPDRTDPDHA